MAARGRRHPSARPLPVAMDPPPGGRAGPGPGPGPGGGRAVGEVLQQGWGRGGRGRPAEGTGRRRPPVPPGLVVSSSSWAGVRWPSASRTAPPAPRAPGDGGSAGGGGGADGGELQQGRPGGRASRNRGQQCCNARGAPHPRHAGDGQAPMPGHFTCCQQTEAALRMWWPAGSSGPDSE